MPQQPVETYFLHVYDVESGLWVHTKLGSGVSPRTLEAMNHILFEDGILAYNGTRSEFGAYASELKRDHGKGSRHCWTSLPASTVMSMLGLCLNMPESGRPELVFYGSPLVVATVYLMDVNRHNLLDWTLEQIELPLQRTGLLELETSMLEKVGLIGSRYLSRYDIDEALSYIKGKSHD
jgi:hypothetical protein